jgi:WD40 repeat protein
VQTLRGHSGQVNAVAFSADGSVLASGGDDARVLLWDAAQARQIGVMPGTGGIRSLVFNHDGSLLASGGDDGRVRIWNLATRQLGRALGQSGPAVKRARIRRGRTGLFAGNDDNRIIRWDVSRGVPK